MRALRGWASSRHATGGSMNSKHWVSLALLSALALVVFAAAGGTASSRSTAAPSTGAAGKDGAVGPQKPLPKFVQKSEGDRIAAADMVARGQASPDANG